MFFLQKKYQCLKIFGVKKVHLKYILLYFAHFYTFKILKKNMRITKIIQIKLLTQQVYLQKEIICKKKALLPSKNINIHFNIMCRRMALIPKIFVGRSNALSLSIPDVLYNFCIIMMSRNQGCYKPINIYFLHSS